MSNTTAKMPSGIPYIISNEAAERFSYYGMKAILVVFMTQYLKMTDSDATVWLHTFSIGVYWFPLIGALIADIFLGKYKTIMTLSIVYCLGHLVLALNETQTGLAWGLTLIAIGSGGIKPCVTAHVGDQFTKVNQHLIERVFSYFYLAINFGAFISMLLTPFLLSTVGPSIAFGLPGILMLIATILFWMGRKKFVAIKPGGKETVKELFSPQGLAAMGKLGLVFGFVAVFWSLFDQTASTWVLQARSDLMDKTVTLFGNTFTLLPSQLQSVNSLFILIFTPLFTFFLYPYLSKFIKVTSVRKILVGLFISALSFVIIAMAENKIANGETVSFWWQIAAYAVLTAAEVMVSVTAYEFAYTQAPKRIKSIIMGLYLLSISLGNVITTLVAKWIIVGLTLVSITPSNFTEVAINDVSNFEVGHKIELKGDNGLTYLKSNGETSPLTGTFLVGEINNNNNSVKLWDINRKPIKANGTYKGGATVSTLSLQGGAYFMFFAKLMFGTAIIFILVAIFYKEKTILQEEEDRE